MLYQRIWDSNSYRLLKAAQGKVAEEHALSLVDEYRLNLAPETYLDVLNSLLKTTDLQVYGQVAMRTGAKHKLAHLYWLGDKVSINPDHIELAAAMSKSNDLINKVYVQSISFP